MAASSTADNYWIDMGTDGIQCPRCDATYGHSLSAQRALAGHMKTKHRLGNGRVACQRCGGRGKRRGDECTTCDGRGTV